LISSGAQNPISARAISTGPLKVLVELRDIHVRRPHPGPLPELVAHLTMVGRREVGLTEGRDASAPGQAVGGGHDGDRRLGQVARPLGVVTTMAAAPSFSGQQS